MLQVHLSQTLYHCCSGEAWREREADARSLAYLGPETGNFKVVREFFFAKYGVASL